MTWPRRIVLVILGLGCGYGCGAPTQDEDPPVLDQPGDPCRADLAWCLDEQTVRECVDDVWTDRTCDESCAELGPAMLSDGCTAGLVDGCVCVPAPGACAPGSTACESNNELGYCGDGQVWAIYDCDDLCAASLATPVSTGCGIDDSGVAACWCVA